MDKPIAKGEKTRLRFLKREDVDAMLRWGRHDDPLLATYDMPKLGPRQREDWYRARTRRADFRIFVVLDRAGNVVGRLSIREIDNRSRRARLGIALDPALVGQGLGTDAVTAFLTFYFEQLRFEELVLDVAAHNLRARRCYEKCGFHYTRERWQKDTALGGRLGLAIFTDERFRGVRKFFRQSGSGLEVLHCDMHITREQYLRARESARRPAS